MANSVTATATIKRPTATAKIRTGGSGASGLLVNITLDHETDTRYYFTLDKTYAEITSAVQTGIIPSFIFISEGWFTEIYPMIAYGMMHGFQRDDYIVRVRHFLSGLSEDGNGLILDFHALSADSTPEGTVLKADI